MRLSQLIEELQYQLTENGDLEVMTSSNYGDYHNTEQLDEIAEITTCEPIESAYSHSGLAYPSDQDYEDDYHDDEYYEKIGQCREQVLVLRYQSR